MSERDEECRECKRKRLVMSVVGIVIGLGVGSAVVYYVTRGRR